MKTFKNKNTGVIYRVTNEALVEQYESRKDLYTEINDVDGSTSKEKKKTQINVE